MLQGEANRTMADRELIYRLTAPIEAVAGLEDASDRHVLAARIVDESFGLEQG